MTDIEGRDAEDLSAAYLKPSVKIEPLVARWHAFQHMIAPIPFALNLSSRLLPLLESFVAAPQVHVTASRDPSLYGGSFVDLPEGHVAQVRAYANAVRDEAKGGLALAAAVRKLDSDLKLLAKGQSLDGLYASLPQALQGSVELLYDPSNNPVCRYREPFLYEGPASTAPLQEILLHQVPAADRKFFLNTPRLQDEDRKVFLKLPFSSALLDSLAEARWRPTNVEDLVRALDVPAEMQGTFRSFFVSAPPERRQPEFSGEGVRVRYFGHASVLVQTKDVAILVDPTFAYERDDALAALTLVDLPDRIDYVVISHAHQDHFSPEVLLQLRSRIGAVVVPRHNSECVADPSMALTLRHLGFPSVVVLDEMDELSIPGGRITSLPFPGEHCGLNIHSRHSIGLQVEGRHLVFLVDSDAIDPALYKQLGARMPKVDAVFVGTECQGAPLSWLYGALLLKPVSRSNDQARRGNGSDSARAWAAIQAMGAGSLYVYALGLEPWNRFLLGLEYEEDAVQLREAASLVDLGRAAGLEARQLKGCSEFVL